MTMSVNTSGLLELAVDLDTAGDQVRPRMSRAIRKTAHDIERTAKRICPVDTGNLRNSISTSISGGAATITAEIGPTADYAGYVEEGTSRQAPQPYMRPAFDAEVPQLLAALRATVITGSL